MSDNAQPLLGKESAAMSLKESIPYQAARKLFYALKDWDSTKKKIQYYRAVRPYRNLCTGQKCFVVGNGPSLKAKDLTRIHHLGIASFGCNRINLIFDQTAWRPTYYFISDAKIMKNYSDQVDGVPETHRFFPSRFQDEGKKGIYYREIQFDYEHEGRFSTDAAKGIYPAASVTTEMIQFAYYMGFSEIYLIGVDFSYSVTQKVDSKTYSYQGENNYFIPGYLKPGEVADMPNINANLLGFKAARDTIEANGRSIYNATRGGKLEVFERVDLDALLKKWEAEKK